MGRPKFKNGDGVIDIGAAHKPSGMVADVMENFGGFGSHYYMVAFLEHHEPQMRSENSLDEVRNASNPDKS